FPRMAGVLGLPDAAAGVAGVVDEWLSGHPRRSDGTSAAEGADVAPLHGAKERGVVGSSRTCLGRQRSSKQSDARESEASWCRHAGESTAACNSAHCQNSATVYRLFD